MGYQDRDGELLMEDSQGNRWGSMALGAMVRVVGVVVLFVGLWVGIKVILEAWALYEQPQRIVRFADDIQKHSNLDGVIGSLGVAVGEAAAQQGAKNAQAAATIKGVSSGLRLSYFAAWFIALLLIFVIGSLAMSAITTGGQLALYDLQLKQYSRSLIKEVRRLRDESA
ncbi:MAG: hypothetical protein ACI8W7_000456 [Gammaproteobacteria bacterium]|jgi:hypothetical protein